MTLFGVLLTLLKLAAAVLEMIKRRRLLSQAETDAIRRAQGVIDERLTKAMAARDRVSDDADSVSGDPNNRDNTA